MSANLTSLVSECRFCAIDFESAGAARGRSDTPVQIGLVVGEPGGGVEAVEHFTSYLRCDQPIEWSARRVHGITPETLADAPALATLWPQILRRMRGSVVVAHGKGTEKRFLRAFPGHGFGPWVDTLLLARAVWPDLTDHSLGALCDVLGLTAVVRDAVAGRSWHDALFDAAASLMLLHHAIDVLDIGGLPVGHLVRPDTTAWHRIRKK